MPFCGEGERQKNISLIIIQNSGKNSANLAGLEDIFNCIFWHFTGSLVASLWGSGCSLFTSDRGVRENGILRGNGIPHGNWNEKTFPLEWEWEWYTGSGNVKKIQWCSTRVRQCTRVRLEYLFWGLGLGPTGLGLSGLDYITEKIYGSKTPSCYQIYHIIFRMCQK